MLKPERRQERMLQPSSKGDCLPSAMPESNGLRLFFPFFLSIQDTKSSKKSSKSLRSNLLFDFLTFYQSSAGRFVDRVSPSECHSLDIKCVGRVVYSFSLASANRQKASRLYSARGFSIDLNAGAVFPRAYYRVFFIPICFDYCVLTTSRAFALATKTLATFGRRNGML